MPPRTGTWTGSSSSSAPIAGSASEPPARAPQSGSTRAGCRPSVDDGAGPFGCGHREREVDGHVGVQLALLLVATARLHVPGQLDPALVEGRAAGPANRLDDLGRRDRAVEPATLAGPHGQLDRERLELALDLVGVPEVADLPSR